MIIEISTTSLLVSIDYVPVQQQITIFDYSSENMWKEDSENKARNL